MTHALADILANRFDDEPEEIIIIKTFVKETFKEDVAVAIRDNQIIIMTRSSALAGALRPHLYKLTRLCNTKRRLLVRIGK